MPLAWQEKFVNLLEELEEEFNLPHEMYQVTPRDFDGKFKEHGEIADYRHGDPDSFRKRNRFCVKCGKNADSFVKPSFQRCVKEGLRRGWYCSDCWKEIEPPMGFAKQS